MLDTFNNLYSGLIKEIFLERARQELEQGADGQACANAYADQGKTDFTLAHLLLAEASDDVKRDILARAYEQRAKLTDDKAEDFARQYHRAFPLIKLEAQKDRLSAQQVRQGKPVLRRGKSINID
jgi:predicted metal-dependent phosphoesterase TrpH